MSRVFFYGLAALVVVFLLSCVGLLFPIEVVFYLAAGWIFYAIRVGPEVKVDWGQVALGALGLAILSALMHSFAGWLYRSIRWNQDSPGRWKARWTASLVAALALMFASGVAATGIAHQTGWLLTSGQPWVSSGSGAAYRAQSVNNLKQIGLALANYDSSQGTLPPAATLDTEGRLLHGWQARVLPFLDHQELYDRIDFTRPWDDPRNEPIFRTRVTAYINPGFREPLDERGLAPSHYSGNVLVLGGDSARKGDDFPDGMSQTFVAGEAAANFRPWGHPASWRDPALGVNYSPDGFGGPSPGGANFLFADGSVRFIKNTVDPKVFRAIATPGGGEKVNADAY